ncbi:MAG: hypothetical protein ACLTQI_09460 [Slackia sp.]
MITNMHMTECSHHSSYSIINRWCDESGAALDWFIEPSASLYITEESYSEVPKKARRTTFIRTSFPCWNRMITPKRKCPAIPRR